MNDCATSTDLGSFAGDVGTGVKTAQGSTSQWLKVRATEDSHSIGGHRMTVRAVLNSPPGVDFDLYLYLPSTDVLACGAPSASSVLSSPTDTTQVEWGEFGSFANSEDDSRWVTVEVRNVSGTCDPAATWSLELYGN